MKTVKLFIKEFGSGKPIIFLHGYPLDHTIWLALTGELEKHARLILADLRGHGQSPAPKGVYSMELMAADVLALMDEMKVEKALLAGHSMGGYVALAFARDYAHRLSGLALVASHCFIDPPDRLQIRLETADQVEKTSNTAFIADSMLPNLTPDENLREKIRPMIVNANPVGAAGVLRGLSQRQETCEVMANLRVPAVIIAGEMDKIIPLDRAKQMAALMKKPWLEIVKGAGHMPMLEAPEKVSEVLMKLLLKSN